MNKLNEAIKYIEGKIAGFKTGMDNLKSQEPEKHNYLRGVVDGLDIAKTFLENVKSPYKER